MAAAGNIVTFDAVGYTKAEIFHYVQTMKTGLIQSLIDVFAQAFRSLQVDLPATELEDLAITVHKAMSVEGRHYHTPEHVLLLADAANPIQSLAALFHDLVYYQVDRGFSAEVWELIRPYLLTDPRQETESILLEKTSPDDLCYRVALDIFGLSPGQKLFSAPGFNEFISALVMGKKLRHLLPPKVLLQAMVYIEATIPFRGNDAVGHGPFELLEQRLRRASQIYAIPLTEAEIEAAISGAVLFANKDVENFSEKDPAQFLDNTWKLLPETNLSLRPGKIYSIRDYRLALEKTDAHFSQMIPEQVFHTYKGVPSEEEYREKVGYTRHNVETARQYLGVKLLTIAILEALAESTGGDAPLSLFIGDASLNGESAPCLADFLPQAAPHPGIDRTSAVYDLLQSARSNPTELADLTNSPLALFVYHRLGPVKAAEYLVHARALFAGALPPEQFLRLLDPALLAVIAQACAKMVPTRSVKLRRYVL